ncbi:hypothetical protein [Leptospira meyeri]|uniref:hypothetical protein n=1 Tax=Leptospira meyeri TaxID=29508 RepID=UPI000C2A6F17|nr:hypothetical protein [Leptospira meyeri]PJZ79864.1 hypothetical protein CH359_15130 [Leptospira meyeri]PJZ96176.1 hypothetical protein CH358_14780 [Leptospira meyeri]
MNGNQNYSFNYSAYEIGSFSLPHLEFISFEKSHSRIFLKLPLVLNLNQYQLKDELYSQIHNINGYLKFNTNQNRQLNYCLGNLHNHEVFYSLIRENLTIFLTCETNISDLIEWERLRNGNEIIADLDIKFSISYAKMEDSWSIQEQGRIFERNLAIQYPIPQKVWIHFLNKLGLYEFHLFELNNSIPEDPNLKRISSAVSESIDFFYQGGPLGFRNSVSKIRDAMNLLDKLCSLPARNGKVSKELSRSERWIESYRSLKNLVHLSQHPEDDSDEWSRAEAQAILTSFLGFWEIRKSLFPQKNSE